MSVGTRHSFFSWQPANSLNRSHFGFRVLLLREWQPNQCAVACRVCTMPGRRFNGKAPETDGWQADRFSKKSSSSVATSSTRVDDDTPIGSLSASSDAAQICCVSCKLPTTFKESQKYGRNPFHRRCNGCVSTYKSR